MVRFQLRLALIAIALLTLHGCKSVLEGLLNDNNPSYTYDANTNSLKPTNDRDYWNGQPMDARTTAPATKAGTHSP